MAPDLGAVEEWRAKDAAYSQRLRDLEAATLQRNQARAVTLRPPQNPRSTETPCSAWEAREALAPGTARQHPSRRPVA